MDVQFHDGRSLAFDPVIAELGWATDPELLEFNFRGDTSAWCRFCEVEWERSDGIQAKERTTLAISSGAIVGLLIHFPGSSNIERFDATVGRMIEASSEEFGAHVMRAFGAMSWLFPAVPPDALYIFNLAVSEAWRGKGLGRRLIAIAVEAAKKEGLTSLHLDTATDRPAVAFYRRLGFSPIVETRLCQLRAGEQVPAHYRMMLPVS